jgi:F0F1-type ATP synthase assembly protein I
MGLYLALGQAGIEMVAPIGIGIILDRTLGWTPWLTLSGVLVGFVGGLAHMLILVKRLNEMDESKPGRGKP